MGKLDNIVFMGHWEQCGKKQRTAALVQKLADELGIEAAVRETAVRAAYLAKADLMTQMVYEFLNYRESWVVIMRACPEKVKRWHGCCRALRSPFCRRRSPGHTACCLCLADKMDAGSLLCPWFNSPVVGTMLCAAVQGVAATLFAHHLPLTVERLSELALAALQTHLTQPLSEVTAQLADFILQRVRFILAEQGLRYDVIDAVLAGSDHNLPVLRQRAQVLQDKLNSPALEQILTPFTRVANLARSESSKAVTPELLTAAAEKELYQAVLAAAEKVQTAAASGDFNAVFTALTPLYQPIEQFFADVMVMAEDLTLRENRLALLGEIKKLFLTLGDISKIVPEKK